MRHLKVIAASVAVLTAIALPATALDQRNHQHKNHQRSDIQYGVDVNFGAVRISTRHSPRYSHRRAAPVRIFIALEADRRHKGHALAQFQKNIRRQFSRAAQGDFHLVHSPRRADIVIRLDRDDWGRSFKRYSNANRKGHFDRSDKMVNRVANRLLERAYDIRSSSYRNVRYDRDYRNNRKEWYSRHHDDRYSNRRDAMHVQYRY